MDKVLFKCEVCKKDKSLEEKKFLKVIRNFICKDCRKLFKEEESRFAKALERLKDENLDQIKMTWL